MKIASCLSDHSIYPPRNSPEKGARNVAMRNYTVFEKAEYRRSYNRQACNDVQEKKICEAANMYKHSTANKQTRCLLTSSPSHTKQISIQKWVQNLQSVEFKLRNISGCS
jgi:hypothetical protein